MSASFDLKPLLVLLSIEARRAPGQSALLLRVWLLNRMILFALFVSSPTICVLRRQQELCAAAADLHDVRRARSVLSV
jgi:hypothetical protein